MYIVHECIKCKREFILMDQDLINIRRTDKEVYIVCPYCSSRQIKVSNKYKDLRECMEDINIFKREHGKVKRVK